MAKKQNKSKNSPKKIDHSARPPSETERSAGFFYVKKNRKSWSLMHESWSGGERSQTKVPEATYYLYGLRDSMSVEQARIEIKSYNEKRKTKIHSDVSQYKALKRLQEIQRIDRNLFPPDLIVDFANDLVSGSDGKERYKKRLQATILVAQEMLKTLNLRPPEFALHLSQMVNYLKGKKYSVSYCKDILSVVDKWGIFFSRRRGTYYERLPQLKMKTQNAIKVEHHGKEGVRHPSQAMTWPILEEMRKRINLSDLSELKKWNWVYISFVFGLRPSEVDAVLENPVIEDKDGVQVLVAIQTKLSGVDDLEKEKRIPVVCEEQERALNLIRQGQAKRPTPQWIDKNAKDPQRSYSKIQKFDLYCGRKGFTDFMISKGQDLQQISIFAGHKSIETTWKFYKDRKSVQYNSTPFTDKKKKLL